MKNNRWRKWWRSYRQDAAAVFAITIFFVLFFHPIFFDGKFFVINDSFVYLYPLRVTAWSAIRSGALPIWTPLIMSGYPLLSMSQIGLAYPLTWGYAFLPGHWGEQIYTLTPHLLTPIFLYAYAREVGRSRLASIFAGLTFGYGGLMVSALANNGLTSNSVMWMPLMLIAIERARTRPFVPCLLGAVAAYSMSVLTGYGQGFVYAGAIAFCYGLFLTLLAPRLSGNESLTGNEWTSWQRWRPFVVTISAMALSAGVAAFQILETMRAQRRSIRSTLSYEIFTEGAYTLVLGIKSFLFPLHYINHATAWVSPLAFVLVVIAIVRALRGTGTRDLRIIFWSLVALVAGILMLGPNTPIYPLIYRIPVINSFRAPARHAYEWTLALAILAGYGWDYATSIFSRAQENRGSIKTIFAILLLVSGCVIGILWHFDFARTPPRWDESNHYPNFPETRYLLWKLAFSTLIIAAVWLGWRIATPHRRTAILIGAIFIASFVEPSLMASRWWWPALKTAERFAATSPTTRFLENYPAEQNRIYTRAVLWTEEYAAQPRLETGNLTMLHGLRNAAGYEPLIFERYSRALGNVWMDGSNPRPGFKINSELFETRSQVLDILNTTFIVSYSDLLTEPTRVVKREGIRFNDLDLRIGLKPGETKELKGVRRECDVVAVVTTLADSADEKDGAKVADVRLFTSDGRVISREIRAGIDSSEWAHERSDLKSRVAHKLAPIFDSYAGDKENTFIGHRYWTKLLLNERVEIERIEINNVSPHAILSVWNVTLYDSATGLSMPLPHYDFERFEPAYEEDGVEIIRNKRALPRAWLVAEAEAVEGEEALRRIQGQSQHAFDPRRTALLEVPAAELPPLPGGPVSSESIARLVAEEPNRLLFETEAPSASILVVSEVIYPGWVATVDGAEVPIHTANFILRGVALPAGKHRVEMRYTAPAARNGAFISIASLLLTGGLAVSYRVRY